jgi:hypothetical protein
MTRANNISGVVGSSALEKIIKKREKKLGGQGGFYI